MTKIPIHSKYLSIVIEKKSEYLTIFRGFFFKEELLTDNWTELIDMLEIFQAFNRNHLNVTKKYKWKSLSEFSLFKHEGNIYLQFDYDLEGFSVSKLESAQIGHKLNRVLSRCNLFYEGE